jgi:predicted RND superfamily exporter protein
MSIVTNILVLAFVYIPTRLVRPTVVVGVLNALASLWWLAVLPELGVGLAITLTLPLVFIYAIGSDYGLHLVLSAIHHGDTAETFRTTGKAVLFSGITTFGAFLIYTQMSNLAVQRTMIATAAAIPIIFLVTMLIVPLFYPTGKRIRKEDQGGAIEDSPLASPPPEGLPPVEIQPLGRGAVLTAVARPKPPVVAVARPKKRIARSRSKP